MADRSRSPLREGKFWWVRVQDRRPIKVFATELGEQQDVDDLISVARRKSELRVAADKMMLYKNADACDVEDSDVSVNEILPDGNSAGKPILIVFDAPEASAQITKQVTEAGKEFLNAIQNGRRGEFGELEMKMLHVFAQTQDEQVQKRLRYLVTGDAKHNNSEDLTFDGALDNFLSSVQQDAKKSVFWAKNFDTSIGVLRLQANAVCFAAAAATFTAYAGNYDHDHQREHHTTVNALKSILHQAPFEAIQTYLRGQGYPAFAFLLSATKMQKDDFLPMSCQAGASPQQCAQYLTQLGVALVTGFRTTQSFKADGALEHKQLTGAEGESPAMVAIGFYKKSEQTFFILQNGWVRKPFVSASWNALMQARATFHFCREGVQLNLDPNRCSLLQDVICADCAMDAGPDACEPDFA